MKPRTVQESWYRELKHVFDTEKFEELSEWAKVNRDYICPDVDKVFKAFSYFDFQETKVVFVALSPYHRTLDVNGIPQKYATGLATGVPSSEFLTPTLGILISALEEYLQIPLIENYFDFTLQLWARQKILLLNRALTVELYGNPKGHLDKWSWFTYNTLKTLSDNSDHPIAFVFMGKDAQELMLAVNPEKHKIIKSCHPVATAYAYDRVGLKNTPIPEHLDFPKARVFEQVDEFMLENYKTKVSWINYK